MSTHHILINGDSRNMSQINDESVGLIITSPPYWQLKNYENERQIGFNQSYEDYINHLNLVWSECYRILQPGRRLCINIGDQFARSAYYGRYKVVAIHSEIIRFCETVGFDHLGSIIWQKETNMHTSGGAKVMGSYPYPVNGYVKIDYEHILLFKKSGKAMSPTKEQKELSKLTDEEWNTYFKSHWCFCGERQNRHIAVFPEELPKRLIKMFSFVGDTICDPFMGSGTTALAALNQHRNSVGYELNESFRLFYNEKVISKGMSIGATFDFQNDNTPFDISESLNQLPYLYKDIHCLAKLSKTLELDYGSKKAFSEVIKKELEEAKKQNRIDTDPMVMVNHVRQELCRKMIEKGICYLRAGDSKGSILVSPGFERMQYVLLHTGGEDCHLFKLKNKGRFQIWTKETLEEYGFHPEHSPYYIVLQFDNTREVEFAKQPNLKQRVNTYRAKIRSLSDFVDHGHPQQYGRGWQSSAGD